MIKTHDNEHVDIVQIGPVARDIIEIDGKQVYASGGGVYYGAYVLLGLNSDFVLVTKVGKNHIAQINSLQKQGIRVIFQETELSSGIHNIYSKNQEERICKPIGRIPRFIPSDLNKVPRANIYLVSPLMAGEVDLDFIKYVSTLGKVACDVQGFVRVPQGDSIYYKPWQEQEQGLRFIDFLKCDKLELSILSGVDSIEKGLEFVEQFGVSEILCTSMDKLYLRSQKKTYVEPLNPKRITGRTGRGDTCFHAYIGARLTLTPKQSLFLAARITERKMENPGTIKADDVRSIYKRLMNNQNLK